MISYSSLTGAKRTTYYILYLLIGAPLLCGPSLMHAHRRRFQPNDHKLNIMTVFRTEKLPEMNECELVKKFNRSRRHKPRKATIDINGDSYCFKAGIAKKAKDADIIYIMSRGHARKRRIFGPDKDGHYVHRGACVIHTRDRIEQKIVHLNDRAVAITFDYQDDYVNLGQKRDISYLKYVYDAIRSVNPNAHIVIVSECLGAKTALEIASRYPIAHTTLVLESPFFVSSNLFKAMAQNYLGSLRWEPVLQWIFRFICHYDWRQDDLLDRISNIPADIPIFACHRNGDPLILDNHFEHGIQQLEKYLTPGQLTHYRFDDVKIRHSSSFRWPGSQRAVNEFYKQHGLPYCKTMVQETIGESFISYLTSLYKHFTQIAAALFC